MNARPNMKKDKRKCTDLKTPVKVVSSSSCTEQNNMIFCLCVNVIVNGTHIHISMSTKIQIFTPRDATKVETYHCPVRLEIVTFALSFDEFSVNKRSKKRQIPKFRVTYQLPFSRKKTLSTICSRCKWFLSMKICRKEILCLYEKIWKEISCL